MAGGRGPGGLTGPNEIPPADPLVGWRYWQVAPVGPVLTSVSHRWSRWPPGSAVRAVCRAGGHRAPAETCACGIHGMVDLASLREHGLCLVPAPVAVGEVALWGRIVRADPELRAEYGRPRRLWLVRETVAGRERSALARSLEEAYGVAVGEMGLEEAVGEMSAALFANQAMAREASALPPVAPYRDGP